MKDRREGFDQEHRHGHEHHERPPQHLTPDAFERGIVRVLRALVKLRHQGETIMSAVSDYVAKQKTFNTRIGTAIDGIVEDIRSLNAKIAELQNSSGTVTPEDQALIDDAQAAGEALAARAEALDAETPPTAPPVT